MDNRLVILFILLSGFLIISCSHLQNKNSDGKLLASAYGNHLYISDIEDQFSEWHSQRDSNEIVSNCIDKWLMEQILESEARKNKAHKNRIEKLVNDYERSLYIHQFEEDYIAEHLETKMDSSEINDYFELHKEAFTPEEDILRYFMIALHKDFDNDTLATLWNTEDLPILKQFITEHEGLMVLDPSKWYAKHELKDVVPEKLYKKISFKNPNNYSAEEDDKKYYVKILEIVKAGDIPPVSYYEDKVKELILRSRSQILVREMKNKIFKEKIKNKSIKIYARPKG